MSAPTAGRRKSIGPLTSRRMNRDEVQIRQMAECIRNQDQLDGIVAQIGASQSDGVRRAEMQRICYHRMESYLRFPHSMPRFLQGS